MDPTTALMVASAVSGATSTLVQQTLTSGGAWIKERFAHHQPAAMEQAIANTNDFLNEFGARVQRLEESNAALRERIATAMDHPDFSVLMQRAFLVAAQSDSHDKHILLAQIVSERLRVDEDTTRARACQMACDAVPLLTSRQLKVLGFLFTLTHMSFSPPTVASEAVLQQLEVDWVQATLSPYRDVTCMPLDQMHLESVGCWGALRGDPRFVPGGIGGSPRALLPELSGLLSMMIDLHFPYPQFMRTDVGMAAQALYQNAGLNSVALTSTGSLIGMFVSDQLASRPTDITTWQG